MSLSRKQFLKVLGFGGLASGLGGFRLAAAAPAAAAVRPKMTIKDIEIYAFDLPLVAPFRISIGEMKAANDVLVRVRTDSGLTGIGEACPFPPITGETQATNIAAAKAIRDMLVGQDPLAIDAVLRLIGPIVHSNPSIVAAFEMACFDILGQAAGLPLYRLFGGNKSTFESDITTGIDTPEAMAASTKKHAAAHVVASQANIVYADLDGNADHTADPVVGGMTTKAGIVTMPEKPGLGCDIDPAFLKKMVKV